MATTLICPVCNNIELNSAKDLLQKLNDKKKGYSAEELFKHLKEEHNYTDLDAFASVYNMFFVEN